MSIAKLLLTFHLPTDYLLAKGLDTVLVLARMPADLPSHLGTAATHGMRVDGWANYVCGSGSHVQASYR